MPLRDPRVRFWFFLLLAWTLCTAYMAAHLLRGWIPHDDGAFAQAAERVLAGEIPHRDFAEIYTGGLTFLNAAAFRFLGVNLATLRFVLFAVFVFWVPVVFWIAARYVSAALACLLTLLMVAWSVPNYAAAVPSWYNLFLACFGAAAILRYLDREKPSWLFVAGLCGGFSFLVKSVALYYIAAVLLFFIFREQDISQGTAVSSSQQKVLGDSSQHTFSASRQQLSTASSQQTFAASGSRQKTSAGSSRPGIFSFFVATSVISIPVLLALLIRHNPQPQEFIHFVLPAAALCLVLVLRETSGIAVETFQRAKTFARMAFPFAAGTLLPVLMFLLFYTAKHSVTELIAGVFILPARRISMAAMVSAPPYHLGATLLVFGPLVLACYLRARFQWILRASLLIVAGALLWGSAVRASLHRTAWDSIAELITPIVLTGAIFLYRADRAHAAHRANTTGHENTAHRARTAEHVDSAVREGTRYRTKFAEHVESAVCGDAVEFAYTQSVAPPQEMMLLMSLLGMCGVVQFPFSAPIYFCYVAPLLILAIAVIFGGLPRPAQILGTGIIVFHLLFAVLLVTPSFILRMRSSYLPDEQTTRLNLDRAGGLRVSANEASTYEQVISLVREHAAGEYIYAGPDCPEVYFLAKKKNPTRDLFDFLDASAEQDGRILAAIAAHEVRVAVIHHARTFSSPLSEQLVATLEREFPQAAIAGAFEVRWKE